MEVTVSHLELFKAFIDGSAFLYTHTRTRTRTRTHTHSVEPRYNATFGTGMLWCCNEVGGYTQLVLHRVAKTRGAIVCVCVCVSLCVSVRVYIYRYIYIIKGNFLENLFSG